MGRGDKRLMAWICVLFTGYCAVLRKENHVRIEKSSFKSKNACHAPKSAVVNPLQMAIHADQVEQGPCIMDRTGLWRQAPSLPPIYSAVTCSENASAQLRTLWGRVPIMQRELHTHTIVPSRILLQIPCTECTCFCCFFQMSIFYYANHSEKFFQGSIMAHKCFK